MSVTSGFFNSVNGDRTYNADDISTFFDGMIGDGVFKNFDGELEVTTPGNVPLVQVQGGKAIVMGKFIKNTGALTVMIAAGGSQPRYDAIVVGVSLEDRTADIYVKQGTPSSMPTPPTMLNNANTKEICLAYVFRPANATSVAAAQITDKRSDESVCGYVKFTNIQANLNVYRHDVTISTAGTDNVAIGIPEFDAATDNLFVYLNGLLMIEVTEYMVKGTGSNASIDLANDIEGDNDNVFTFVVFKMSV